MPILLTKNKLNMENSSKSYSVGTTGIGVSGLLGVAFVVLKLTGFINWSWWWVTLPFWGGFVILLIILAVLVVLLKIYG